MALKNNKHIYVPYIHDYLDALHDIRDQLLTKTCQANQAKSNVIKNKTQT